MLPDFTQLAHSFTKNQNKREYQPLFVFSVCLFVCFVALRPKSTAVVMAGRSVHLTTLFFCGKLEQAVNQYFVHILSLVTDNNPS